MSEVNINITVQLSEKLEDSIQQLVHTLTTARYWETDDDFEDEDEDTD
jgi:hypothetical protein